MSRPAERLVEELARGLAPVEPMPRLRRMAGWVLVLGALAGGLGVALLGPNAGFLASAARHPSIAVIALGLLATAAGGVVAALAGAIPGREAEARAATALMAAGALLAVVVGGVLAGLGKQAALPAAPAAAAAGCLSLALLLSLPAAAAALALVSRGAPGRPFACLAAGVAGTAALGAFANHLCCTEQDFLHLLLGHALAPGVGVALLAIPIAGMLRLRARGRLRVSRRPGAGPPR